MGIEWSLGARCTGNLRAIGERAARVHCLTNPVAMSLTANLLLAVGARPSMTQAADQVGEFIAVSDALCVNLGMLDEARRQAIALALEAAASRGCPWVLDPVKVHVSATRCGYARDLLHQRPAVIRGNAREIVALAGTGDDPAGQLARQYDCVVAQTGAVDLITDGHRRIELARGHPLMPRVIGLGCALSGLVATFLAVDADPLLAAASAVLALDLAGEQAAAGATGPASLGLGLVDALYNLDSTAIDDRRTP